MILEILDRSYILRDKDIRYDLIDLISYIIYDSYKHNIKNNLRRSFLLSLIDYRIKEGHT